MIRAGKVPLVTPLNVWTTCSWHSSGRQWAIAQVQVNALAGTAPSWRSVADAENAIASPTAQSERGRWASSRRVESCRHGRCG